MLSGVKGLFMYNRQSFQFNKTLDQERLYHLQRMRLEQLKLYREDIRCLFELVVGKMDNYYLVNTLALGFSLAFYYEGKVPSDIPSWLFWLWAMSLGSAIVCLFLSVWFAVHASVVAQMFSARILTQWLRLPIPGPDQIDAGAPKLEDFENVPVKEQLRIPIISKQTAPNGRVGPLDPPTTDDPLIQEGYNFYLGHFYMFSRLQKHWMSLDAYCRVCMVLGCNQILNAVTYTGLSYFTLFDYQWGTIAFLVIPVVFACIHVHINLLLTRKEAIIFLMVHSLAPLLAGSAAASQMVFTNDGQADKGALIAQAISVGSYVCHFLSSGFFLFLGLELQNGLPTRFTAVNYIDVLGIQGDVPVAPEPAGGLRRGISTRLSEIFSLTSSNISAEKAQPPIGQVVPPSDSMRKADRMYQSLVMKKVGGTVLLRTSSAPHIGGLESVAEAPLDGFNETQRHQDLVFATQVPVPRGSVKLLNDMLESAAPRLQRFGSATVLAGPKDYAPTVAQLHAPDVLATMPFTAFRVVGFTILSLWFAGIAFGSLSLTGSVDIGWENVVSPTIHNSSTAQLIESRRLLQDRYVAPPGRFLHVDTFSCFEDGSYLIGDETNERSFLIEAGIPSDTWFAGRPMGTARVTARRLGGSPRSFLVDESVEVVFPIKYGVTNDPLFFLDEASLRIFCFAKNGELVVWDSTSGKFLDSVGRGCPREVTINPPIGVCCSGSEVTVVFRRGDSCKF